MKFLPLALLLALLPAASAQDKGKPDPAKVDEAIKKGADWLLKKYGDGTIDASTWTGPVEIVVLTLSHAGVKKDDPGFQKLLDKMLKAPLAFTYRVCVRAMALQRIDPEKYKTELMDCAQWLVDTQLYEGEWGYPGTLHDEKTHPTAQKVDPAPPPVEKDGKKLWKVARRAKFDPKVKGDMSHIQFALLGLRACMEAGIEVPKECWANALKYLLMTQRGDGGWGYYFADRKDKSSYGSMTLAGICSVAMCRYYLGVKDALKNALKDPAVTRGMAYMARRIAFDQNPEVTDSNVIDPRAWHYYYLYSLERTGIICNTEKFGAVPWYDGGAKWLLDNQRRDGSWTTGEQMAWKAVGSMETPDTCFAILFLTRSTPPLVETGGAKKPEPTPPPPPPGK